MQSREKRSLAVILHVPVKNRRVLVVLPKFFTQLRTFISVVAVMSVLVFAVVSPAIAATEQESFKWAAGIYKTGKFAAAQAAWDQFLKVHPNGKRAADATYLSAETLFRMALSSFVPSGFTEQPALTSLPGFTGGIGVFGMERPGGGRDRGKSEEKQKEKKSSGRDGNSGRDGVGGKPGAAAGADWFAGAHTAWPASGRPVGASLLEQAIKKFQDVIGKYPKSGLVDSAWLRIAEANYHLENWPESIAAFRKVSARGTAGSLTAEALLEESQSQVAAGNLLEARAVLARVRQDYPAYQKSSELAYVNGMVAYQDAAYPAAEEQLRDVQTPYAMYYSAKALLHMERPLPAVARLRTLLNQNPANLLAEEASFLVAEGFFQARDYDAAVGEYQKFVAKYPGSIYIPLALYRIGLACLSRKEPVEARSALQNLIDTYPKSDFAAFAQYFIGEAFLAQKMYDQAKAAYDTLLAKYPASPARAVALYKVGWSQTLGKKFDLAAQAYRKFVTEYQDHPLSAQAQLLLGSSLARMDQHEDAVRAYQRVVDLAPKTDLAEQAMALITRSHYARKDFEQMITGYQYILNTYPPSKSKWRAMTYLYVGDAYYRTGRINDAAKTYDGIVKAYPNSAAAILAQDGLAWCAFQRGEYEQAAEARAELEEMAYKRGGSTRTVAANDFEAGNSYFNQKKYDQAIEKYERFASVNPRDTLAPEALYRTGLAYYRMKYYSQAVATWLRVDAGYPSSMLAEPSLLQASDTLFRAQKYADAIEKYRRYQQKYPSSPSATEAALRIAQAYYNLAQDGKALEQIIQTAKLFQSDPQCVDLLDVLEGIADRKPTGFAGDFLRDMTQKFEKTKIGEEALYRLGRRRYAMREYTLAIQSFESFAVLYPESERLSQTQFYLGESYLGSKRPEDAVNVYRRFVQNFPKSDKVPVALFHMGNAQYELKAYDAAAATYAQLLKDFPDSEFASPSGFNQALAYKALGLFDEAEVAYRKFVESAPKSEGAQAALWDLVTLQMDQKKFTDAAVTLEKIIAGAKPGDTQWFEANYRVGQCKEGLKEIDAAAARWQMLVQAKPAQNPFRLQALVKLAEMYEKSEKWQDAATMYEDLSKSARNPEWAAAAREKAAALRQAQGIRQKG